MPEPAYLTYGNVDMPGHVGRAPRPGSRSWTAAGPSWAAGRSASSAAACARRYHTPHEIDEDEYAAKVDAVGQVDVLCTHIPPAVPELLFDTVAERMERGSAALLAAIRRTRPRYALFGHVHQPLARRVRVGVTECVNVGHFRATGLPYVLRW